MTVRWLVGDCRQTLPTLEPGSIQACITSPPYFNLRDYGTPPLVWGGDPEHVHEWWEEIPGDNRGGSGTFNGRNGRGENYGRDAVRGAYCDCGAWRGSLGLEPTPELFIEHLVECFSHVKRALRDDGVLWLNMGDSYASGTSARRSEGTGGVGRWHNDAGGYDARVPTPPGFKTKDLMLMPFRVAMALQADGWWLRSVIPWVKRNAMPESVTDRPSTSIEYVFLLAKSARYYWDADAVRVPYQPSSSDRAKYAIDDIRSSVADAFRDGMQRHVGKAGGPRREHPAQNANGRNRRNGDWFFESWHGLLGDEEGDPLALVVNPAPFSGAHFATFPPKLVEPMVKASTREGDTILDPFGGAGTVGLVADRLGRNAILCELKQEYTEMAVERVTQDAPLFAEVAAD